MAKVTCRKSRKEFSVKLNPDAHWSSDDQAGFRLDTTFTHRQGKCLTLENAPSLTTRTDFMNPYSSLLQTTSYLFMKSDTTEKACAGVVKPHFNFPKNATQLIIDLEMLESRMPNYFDDKPIECIRVDGATKDQVTWRYSFCGLKGTCSSRKCVQLFLQGIVGDHTLMK